jgi:hypothetical protein
MFMALLIAGSLALYVGFFYLLALALQMGTPLDALWAGLYRAGLGLGATLLGLMVHISMRMSGSTIPAMARTSEILTWGFRIAIWTWVLTWVYRVTRWRKWKLAVGVAAGLALNAGADFVLRRLGEDYMPSFGTWLLRLC